MSDTDIERDPDDIVARLRRRAKHQRPRLNADLEMAADLIARLSGEGAGTGSEPRPRPEAADVIDRLTAEAPRR